MESQKLAKYGEPPPEKKKQKQPSESLHSIGECPKNLPQKKDPHPTTKKETASMLPCTPGPLPLKSLRETFINALPPSDSAKRKASSPTTSPGRTFGCTESAGIAR